ncbi:hypothetical protein WDU99_01875 [Microbacterium sp. Mu-80]|uniref:Ribbon-helix-helix protein, CopG family n=1 Tax=Microbacterium bandirmense TaxID=3122050 RepID=A0ABU8L7U7_9MICO
MVKKPMVARQIRVPAKLWDEAKGAAAANDETISDVIRRALVEYVKENQS